MFTISTTWGISQDRNRCLDVWKIDLSVIIYHFLFTYPIVNTAAWKQLNQTVPCNLVLDYFKATIPNYDIWQDINYSFRNVMIHNFVLTLPMFFLYSLKTSLSTGSLSKETTIIQQDYLTVVRHYVCSWFGFIRLWLSMRILTLL